MLFFSPSSCGFYDSAINATIPPDAVEVTPAERQAALDGLVPDTRIAGGPDGKPIIIPMEFDPADLLARLRSERDRRLRASDHTQLPDIPMDQQARATWATYRQALRDLPETTTDLAAVAWPDPPAA